MTPIPYVKRCSWDHLLITWAPRSNAVLYYCAKVLYFFIFLEIVLAVPDKGQLCSFIVKGETERCRKSDFWRGSIWGDRKERGFNITKLYNLFYTALLRLHSNHSILKIATSNYDFNAILHLCKKCVKQSIPYHKRAWILPTCEKGFFQKYEMWDFIADARLRFLCGSHTLFTKFASTFFNKNNFKIGFHSTIHTFKNYFIIVFSIFNFQISIFSNK